MVLYLCSIYNLVLYHIWLIDCDYRMSPSTRTWVPMSGSLLWGPYLELNWHKVDAQQKFVEPMGALGVDPGLEVKGPRLHKSGVRSLLKVSKKKWHQRERKNWGWGGAERWEQRRSSEWPGHQESHSLGRGVKTPSITWEEASDEMMWTVQRRGWDSTGVSGAVRVGLAEEWIRGPTPRTDHYKQRFACLAHDHT